MRTRQFPDGVYILKPGAYKTETGANNAAEKIRKRSKVKVRTYKNSSGLWEVLWSPPYGNWITR